MQALCGFNADTLELKHRLTTKRHPKLMAVQDPCDPQFSPKILSTIDVRKIAVDLEYGSTAVCETTNAHVITWTMSYSAVFRLLCPIVQRFLQISHRPNPLCKRCMSSNLINKLNSCERAIPLDGPPPIRPRLAIPILPCQAAVSPSCPAQFNDHNSHGYHEQPQDALAYGSADPKNQLCASVWMALMKVEILYPVVDDQRFLERWKGSVKL